MIYYVKENTVHLHHNKMIKWWKLEIAFFQKGWVGTQKKQQVFHFFIKWSSYV